MTESTEKTAFSTPFPCNLKEIQKKLLAGAVSMTDLVLFYLENIRQTTPLNAYVEVFEEEILQSAVALEEKIGSNPAKLGKLFGAVLSIKDNICYAGHKVTAASEILEGFESPYSATAVERLLREDALIIGRTNCDQFGMGSSNENSIYGPTRNPFDPEKVPGGSSGGAAVSVATDTCLAAIGSDTGGSIRQPAGFCGILGIKPNYGRISRHGLLAYGSSFDQIGYLSKDAETLRILLEISSGPDEFDSTASLHPIDFSTPKSTSTQRIAYFPAITQTVGVDSAIANLVSAYLSDLEKKGHTLVPLDFPLLEYAIPAYYVLTTAEASSNLSRYDGIRYGKRSKIATNIEETYLFSRTQGFSEEVKKRILLGTFVLSSGYYDAYYSKAQKVRRLIRDFLTDILAENDLVFLPVSPILPWKLGEKNADPVAMYLADAYTVLANLAGIPAVAYPIGNDEPTGLPIGVQMMAAPFEEGKLLAWLES